MKTLKLILLSLPFIFISCTTDQSIFDIPKTGIEQEGSTYEKDGYCIYDGDILLKKDGSRTYSNILSNPTIWPEGIVYYNFNNCSVSHKENIRRALHQLMAVTSIKFVEEVDMVSGPLITFNFIENGDCNSHLGMHPVHQNINLTSGCFGEDKVLHEVFHALGVHHEHNRSDRDDYIEMFWENIKTNYFFAFTKQNEAVDPAYGSYDYKSIMHYNSHAFTKTGNPVFKKRNGELISTNTQLTKSDINGINYLYRNEVENRSTITIDVESPSEFVFVELAPFIVNFTWGGMGTEGYTSKVIINTTVYNNITNFSFSPSDFGVYTIRFEVYLNGKLISYNHRDVEYIDKS
ncbi:M12 family metallopeptidase [Flammeovirga kamogawensis]|uniref:Peptidase M12A domain-containing protein n=1 Tax=Flammeovirga kamogawensis TaxID=373891 RepID=A0ABX8H4U8_9BACT|nr:M12 family metallopeptidase [Flammeovirga kamogawensis]MBB6461748.1 hypothetical protein [Flammeovirga kamogawensis]QWG10664.1 hypothetical protein KM029_25105 [Flammeovirga kamogawensis]TRX63768.1 hypothetical protein EO216_25485 [Flammeovirga kamogawensis]